MTLLDELRNQTQSYHQKIEQNHLFKQITDKVISREQYIYLLKKLFGYWNALEENLQKHAELDFYLHERPKLALLRKDLLVMEETPRTIALLPRCKLLPKLNTYANCLGCLYVMEGSTLGGRILAKLLFETLAISADTGSAYFSCYGSKTHAMWENFCQYLQEVTQPSAKQQAITSAIQTFNTLDNWLLTTH